MTHDIEKVIKELHDARRYLEDKEWSDRGASPHIDTINNVLALLKEQQRIIEQYQKADGFLFAHGWKWENYIDTQEETHPIEVGEDGLPY